MPRPSHVRDAIRARFEDTANHGWAIDELQEDLRNAGVPADFSSVFRALVWLESAGVVQRVDLGDDKARYEPAGVHHEHVQCEQCGTVGVLPDCVVEEARAKIERSTGFSLGGHRLVLTGLCPDCQGR